MNPLIVFDYIYYRIAYFYDKRFGYKESKEFSGIIILSLIQFVNILALLDLFKINDSLVKTLPNHLFIIAILCLLNYARYIKLLNFRNLEDKWGNENKNVRLIKSIIVIIYFLLSFYLLVP